MSDRSETIPHAHVAIVGAGPIGLEVHAWLKQAGVGDILHLDKGQIGSTIAWFPQGMTFFSSTDRIAIAGIPIQTAHQTKATKEEYLAHLRTVAMAHDLSVCTYERVTAIEPRGDGGSPRFTIRTQTATGSHTYTADNVVLATGDMEKPRTLGVPGEDLPHVSHYFEDPHRYFRKRLLVVGGKNSAVEAALRCYHAGASVAMSYRREAFREKSVKYWLLPELTGRIKRGEIALHAPTQVERIAPTHVTLKRCDGSGSVDVEADFVLLLTGYVADMSLFEAAGVSLGGPGGEKPKFDRDTMQTNVPGLYVAGTATAGTQAEGYKVFIENCHIQARRIVAAVTGGEPPGPDRVFDQPEA